MMVASNEQFSNQFTSLVHTWKYLVLTSLGQRKMEYVLYFVVWSE